MGDDSIRYWLPNDVYDKIKWTVTVLLPALTGFYVVVAATWHWPYATEVEKTLLGLYACLCALIGASSYTAKPAPIDPDATADLGRKVPEV